VQAVASLDPLPPHLTVRLLIPTVAATKMGPWSKSFTRRISLPKKLPGRKCPWSRIKKILSKDLSQLWGTHENHLPPRKDNSLGPWKTASKLHKGLEVTVMQTAERGLFDRKRKKQTNNEETDAHKKKLERERLNEQ
jgi:hypothetical protein